MTKTNVQPIPSNSQHHDTPNNKTHVIKFRVTAEEKASLELTCKLLNLSLSTFIRRAIHNVKIEKTVIVASGGEETLTAVSTLLATTMRPFCPQFEIFRLEKNAMLTLEWIGKNKVVNHHQEVSFRVLERQYSFDEQGQHTENNDSENMIIHGDNLEALKALLPQYEGKVKCIYIVILTPILMSILSSENAVRLNFIIHIMFLALFEMRNYNVLCGGAKWTI